MSTNRDGARGSRRLDSIAVSVDWSIVGRVVGSAVGRSVFSLLTTSIKAAVSSMITVVVLFVVAVGFLIIVEVACSAVAARAFVRVRMAALVLASTTTLLTLLFLQLFFSCAVIGDLLHPFVGELLCHIGNALKQNVSQRRHLDNIQGLYPSYESK